MRENDNGLWGIMYPSRGSIHSYITNERRRLMQHFYRIQFYDQYDNFLYKYYNL